MSEDIHRQLIEFLAREFARGEGRQCILLELVSAQPGMKGDAIRTWDRRETPDVFEGQGNVESLVTEIVRLAEGHAESFGSGLHRFEVRTQQHLGGRQKSAFRIRSEGEAEESGSGEDAPTATGLVGQLMRHNEVGQRVLAQVYQQTLGAMSRTMAEFAEENRALRQDRGRHLAELEQAKTAEIEREVTAQRQIAADTRKDEALKKLYDLMPVIKARLLGAGQTQAGETPETILLRELAGSFSPEQMARIASALTPNQTILLGELMKRAREASPPQGGTPSNGTASGASAASPASPGAA